MSGCDAGESRECLACALDADGDDGLCGDCRERERPYRPAPPDPPLGVGAEYCLAVARHSHVPSLKLAA